MLKTFINRPVLATVVSLILVILGLVGMLILPVSRFPEIAPPRVVVSLSYPGANSERVAESALLPVEEAINGVEDMTYITSTATNSGCGSIQVVSRPAPIQILLRLTYTPVFLEPYLLSLPR